MTEPVPNVYASPYAMKHPDAYELTVTCWLDGVPLTAELLLVDLEDRVIDEDGCNCDLDSPCNNPLCVKQREDEMRYWGAYFARRPDLFRTKESLDQELRDAGRGHLIRPN